MGIEILPIKVTHEIEPGQSLVNLIAKSKANIDNGDIIVVSQKAISKSENKIVFLDSVIPSLLSVGIASEYDKNPKLIEVILSESKRIVRMNNGVIITETYHGFVCANAGVDESNVPDGFVTLLPQDPDLSAKKIQTEIQNKFKKNVGVLISDTFGRPFRVGQTDQAIGICGLNPLLDYMGKKDNFGKILRVTSIAIADELCAAAELVMGKTNNCPFAIVKNFPFDFDDGSIRELLRPEQDDLFR